MHARLVKWAAALAALFMMSGAWGATATTAPCTAVPGETCASVVTGVTVDGSIYTVSFAAGSYTDLNTGGNFPFADSDPQDEANALSARDQILAALDGAGATRVGSEGSVVDPFINFYVPYGFAISGDIRTKAAQHTGGSPTWFAFNGLPPVGDEVAYATFSVVPVPAAVWLFGSALGMLGWIRRRSS